MNPTETQAPTEQEQIKYLKAQMPLKRLQVELQKLNMEFVEFKVREFEAVQKLQQIDAGQREAQAKQDEFLKENIIEHTITQADLDMNPELIEANIVVGQKIGIPKEIYKDVKLANKVSLDEPATTVGNKEEVRENQDSPLSVVKD